jgi:DNA-binding SARP family transcriptional activator
MSPPADLEGVERTEAVRIWLLSGFRVAVGPRTVEEGAWRLRKAAILVKLLSLAAGHRMHREQAMDLLWPESAKKAASNNLRQTLHAARRTLASDPAEGSRYLASEDESLVLCPDGPLWVDVEAFEEATATARRAEAPGASRAALELYSGGFLPGDRYEEWAEGSRQELRHTWLSLHVELARVYEWRGEYEKGTEVLQRAVSEKPTNERMHAGLMRLYALSDRPVQALVQYEHLREILSGQLDAEPSSTATRRLRDEIAAGRLPPTYLAATPPEDSPDASKHNLPAPRTKFIGREREVVEVKRRLAMTNLLTLTGAGGCGKTWLALKVARDLVGTYPDGVWLVELVPLSEGGLVPHAVARVLDVPEQPNRPLTATLAEALKARKMLIVPDDCEHLVEACARLVDVLLGSCPGVRVLATSREPLNVAGEVVWRVPSFPVLDVEHPPTVEGLTVYESVRLFVERALCRPSAF